MEQIKEYEQMISKCFKSINGHLKLIKVKDFKQLKKLNAVANYTVEGEFTGYTQNTGFDVIQIPLNNITNRTDIPREINLQQERLLLDVVQALNNK